MTKARQIEPGVWIAGQIQPDEIAALAGAGIAQIVNNRPDGEAAGQPPGVVIAAAAAAGGLAYVAIPIVGGFAAGDIAAMRAAVAAGPVLAYCKSGYRSAALWAAARASEGADAATLIAQAAAAGQDLHALGPMLNGLRPPR